MANAVLVAEPEPSTRGFLERHLADDGFDVLGAAECGHALELAERARPDLVLLGDTAALDECRSWSSEVPLIVIGAPEADAVDRARALERGADDFLSRPFLYDELLARIRAVLRRTAPVVPNLVQVDALEIDRPTRRVMVGGKRIDLAAEGRSSSTCGGWATGCSKTDIHGSASYGQSRRVSLRSDRRRSAAPAGICGAPPGTRRRRSGGARVRRAHARLGGERRLLPVPVGLERDRAAAGRRDGLGRPHERRARPAGVDGARRPRRLRGVGSALDGVVGELGAARARDRAGPRVRRSGRRALLRGLTAVVPVGRGSAARRDLQRGDVPARDAALPRPAGRVPAVDRPPARGALRLLERARL